MNKDILIIVRHKLERNRLLMRALHSISEQTYTHKKCVIYCADFDKDNPESSVYLSQLEKDYTIISNMKELHEKINQDDHGFICFLDDDDSWAPEYLARLISILNKTHKTFPSVRAITCHTNKVKEICEGNRVIIDNTTPWNHYLETGPVDFDVIHYINSIPLSSCIFMKESIVDILPNHNPGSPAFGWPLLIEYLSENDIWILPEALSFYHFREENDHEYGNYSIIKSNHFEIEYKININNMMRRKDNKTLLNLILNKIVNKTNFYRISELEKKING